VIFDVDGVLVDVHGSFHKSIIDTIHFFTGRRVTYAEIHDWKNRSGYNDDWRLTTDWVASLGKAVPYAVVKSRFQEFYWGTKRAPGNVSRERWLITHARLARWSQRAELALFTGRTRQELVGMTPMELFGASRETLERDYDAIIADNNSSASRIEGQYRHKDGSLFTVYVRNRLVLDDDGGIARHVCLDARRCGCLVDDFPHRGHGLDAGRRALIADEEYLHIGGLAVRALRPGSGQRITPEVLQTLDVRGVAPQLTNDVVIEVVCAVAEFVLSLQNDHRRRVAIELMEYLTNVHHGLECRRLLRCHRHRVLGGHFLEWWREHAERGGEQQPEQNDRYRKSTNESSDDG